MTAPAVTDQSQFDDAWEMINYQLQQWGIDSLSGKARDMLIEGDSPDVVTLKLADSDEYRQRFSANEARRKAGLRVLSPGEYLEVERQYRDIMRRNGLPEGFYDQLDDYKKFIESDVSPQELSDRVQAGVSRIINAAPEMTDQMNRLYGMGASPSAVLAGMLDLTRALPILQRQIDTASIAAEAQRAFRDVNHLSANRADELARLGVTGDQARNAFGELAGREGRDSFLAGLAGRNLTEKDQEDELLLGDQRAAMTRRKVQEAERARFNGNFLATDRGQGLARNTSGTY